MDPLSVSASIIGITLAIVQISPLLKAFIDDANNAPTSARRVLTELTGIQACLQQLQRFLLGDEEAPRNRRSLVMIEQIVVIFADCVSTFSELEQTLESLKTGEHMRVIDRLKWSLKETTISKILARLQSSKTSLNFMLTILTCTSMDWAEASMRNLTSLVQDVLKSNINMAARMRNLERRHPALARSISPLGGDAVNSEASKSRAASRMTCPTFTFEEELETSTVYQRQAANRVPFSKSSTSSNGPSYLSGLSLSDVSNVSAIALPIFSMELWNHYRYSRITPGSSTVEGTSLEAWYNPPAKRSAFIRTAYFNGRYTNQYAQSKFTGHIPFRRFTITAPYSPPVFTEGAVMPRSPKELEKIGEEASEKTETFELEDTAVESEEASPTHMPLKAALEMGELETPKGMQHLQFHHPRKRLRPPQKPLPLAPPTAWRNGKVRTARRQQTPSPSCSILCDEEEAIFPTRKWSKPLAEMGDALNWKLSVLHHFNAIQY